MSITRCPATGAATGSGCAAAVPRIAAPIATSFLGWLSMASGQTEGRRELLADQGDPRRTADHDDRGQIRRLDPGRLQHPSHRRDGLPDRRPQHVRELVASQPDHRRRHPRQRHRDHRLDVTGQRLLRQHAVVAQPGQSDDGRRVGVVQFRPCVPQRGQHVLEHRHVEVDPAQVLDTVRRTEQPEAVPVADHRRRVERAATQVVDGHPSALGRPTPRGVGDRRRLRLGARARTRAYPGDGDRLTQQVTLERPPVRRMSHADVFRPATLLPGREIHHPRQQPGQHRLRPNTGHHQ